MPRRPSRKPYTGVLLERLPPPNSVSKDEWHRMIAERERALFEHYGINADDPDRWERVISELVLDHVPGFQDELAPGHKAEANRDSRDAFIITQFFLAKKRGKSWRKVAESLAAEEEVPKSPEALDEIADSILAGQEVPKSLVERRPGPLGGMTAERIRQRAYELLKQENGEALRRAMRWWAMFTK